MSVLLVHRITNPLDKLRAQTLWQGEGVYPPHGLTKEWVTAVASFYNLLFGLLLIAQSRSHGRSSLLTKVLTPLDPTAKWLVLSLFLPECRKNRQTLLSSLCNRPIGFSFGDPLVRSRPITWMIASGCDEVCTYCCLQRMCERRSHRFLFLFLFSNFLAPQKKLPRGLCL